MSNNRNKRSAKKTPTAAVSVLKDIRESLISTQISSEPDVRDIQLARFNSKRIFNFDFTQVNLISTSAVSETDGAISFQLNNLTGYTALTSLFDQYRIIGVHVQFTPSQSVYTSAAAPIYTVLDYDDSAATATTALSQYDTLKIAPATVYFQRDLKPRAAVAMYSGTFASFGNTGSMWIDSASPAVVYYGLKYAIPASGSTPSWTVFSRVMIQCRHQR
jgi:hypothetical protein